MVKCASIYCYNTNYKLNVAVSPHFITQPKDIGFNEMSEASLNCSAVGRPPPTITWLRNSSEIKFKETVNITSSSQNLTTSSFLKLEQVSRADIGQYKCVAANEVGSQESQPASLDVFCMSNGLPCTFV